jgi:hypothetical protein
MLYKYLNFKENLILESIINETYLYYSPPLVKVLNKIDSDISRDLLSIKSKDIEQDITFVNIDKEGYLSFSNARNSANNLSKIYKFVSVSPEKWFESPLTEDDLENIWIKHISNNSDDVYSKSRSSLRIGKLINKLFTGKYTDKQIEDFVNKFKSTIINSSEKFEIVEGDEIAFWYDSKNYAEQKGSLGGSCMKAKSKSVFDIYIKNPEVCRMLILKEDDKILGRALIWKINKVNNRKDVKFEYFLDRQYTSKDSDVEKFRTYAKENGWAYKAYNNHHSTETVVFNEYELNVEMSVRLNSISYTGYPYLDTFKRYDPYSNTLYNDADQSSDNQGHYILEETDGGYNEITSGVWSEWHDRTIDEDEAVWSDWADSYLIRDRATLVEDGNRRYHGWYPEDCDDIVYDEFSDMIIHVEDSVYSNAYGYSIFIDNAVEVISEIDYRGEIENASDNWYHKNDDDIIETRFLDTVCIDRLTELYADWLRYEWISKELIMRNDNDDWILKLFMVKSYKIKYSKPDSIAITGIDWLTEIDADILGHELDMESEKITDKFRYHSDIEEILHLIKKETTSKIEKMRNDIEEKGQLRIKFDNDEDRKYIDYVNYRINQFSDRLSEIEDKIYVEI